VSSIAHTGFSSRDSVPPLALDRTSFVPFYRQIADQIRELIHSGRLMPGRPFWSEGAIAEQLGVSKMTVRQGLQVLRAEGLLVVERGKRPVVGAGKIQKDFQELRSFTEEMSRRGLKASSKLLAIALVEPDLDIARALRLGKIAKVYRIRRLRFANQEIVGLETTHLPARICPDLEKQDLANQSLYSVLEKLYNVRLEWSEEELEAVPAEKEEAKWLEVRRGFPLFSMRRTVYSTKGIPVEYGLSLFRSDRYSAAVISRRKG